MTSRSDTATSEVFLPAYQQALAYGDDALVMSQRLAEWVARAPEIEEDVALANIALDLLGQARMLLTYAGSLTDPPQTEDDLAYWRDPSDFRNAVLVERENGDYAVTMVRLLLFSGYLGELYSWLRESDDPTLAAIAAKALPEVRYHRDHARLWVLRLGDGTDESHRRMVDALDAEWPWFDTLFTPVGDLHPGALAANAREWVAGVLAAATLTIPDASPGWRPDGRRGEHTAALDELLAEFQIVARAHPGASW